MIIKARLGRVDVASGRSRNCVHCGNFHVTPAYYAGEESCGWSNKESRGQCCMGVFNESLVVGLR